MLADATRYGRDRGDARSDRVRCPAAADRLAVPCAVLGARRADRRPGREPAAAAVGEIGAPSSASTRRAPPRVDRDRGGARRRDRRAPCGAQPAERGASRRAAPAGADGCGCGQAVRSGEADRHGDARQARQALRGDARRTRAADGRSGGPRNQPRYSATTTAIVERRASSIGRVYRGIVVLRPELRDDRHARAPALISGCSASHGRGSVTPSSKAIWRSDGSSAVATKIATSDDESSQSRRGDRRRRRTRPRRSGARPASRTGPTPRIVAAGRVLSSGDGHCTDSAAAFRAACARSDTCPAGRPRSSSYSGDEARQADPGRGPGRGRQDQLAKALAKTLDRRLVRLQCSRASTRPRRSSGGTRQQLLHVQAGRSNARARRRTTSDDILAVALAPIDRCGRLRAPDGAADRQDRRDRPGVRSDAIRGLSTSRSRSPARARPRSRAVRVAC